MVLIRGGFIAHVLWRAGSYRCPLGRQQGQKTGGLSQAEDPLSDEPHSSGPPETGRRGRGRPQAVRLTAPIASGVTKAALPEGTVGRQLWPAHLCHPDLCRLGVALCCPLCR